MSVPAMELRMRCMIALKELRERGINLKLNVGKMKRHDLTGAWGQICKEMDALN